MICRKIFSAAIAFALSVSALSAEKRVLEINIHLKSDGSTDVSKNSALIPVDPEKRYLLVKDSDTGSPIVKADVDIDKRWKTVTNDEGKATIPDEVDDGNHKVTIKKPGDYVPTEINVRIEDGEIASSPQVSMPPVVDYERIKVVLDWGESPSDLDAHFISSYQHVYYSNMRSDNIVLDHDDTSSFGPETMTLTDMRPYETYGYYVLNYSDRNYPDSLRLSHSGAQVRVFVNNELAGTFKVPANKSGILWHVFDIVNGTEVVGINEILKERM